MKFFGILTVVLAVGPVVAQESSDGSLAAVSREIEQVRAKLSQNDKDNPHVCFADQDNPTRNIHRTMKGVRINREFYCPYHRGYKYVDGVCGWTSAIERNPSVNRRDLAGCPALSNNINGYAVWRSYCDQVTVTEQKEAERKRLQERLQALQEQRTALILASDRSSRKAAGSNANADAIVIRLPKKKVYELYSNKVTYHDGYKLILQP